MKTCGEESGISGWFYGGGFLTHAVAEVVELGATNLTAGHNLNLGVGTLIVPLLGSISRE